VDGNLAAGLDAFLGKLGVARSGTQDAVEQELARVFADRGLDVTVVGLRYATLTVTADPPTARLLRYDQDRLLRLMQDVAPGAVTRLVIHPRRR
jgi:hypothetical protein